MKEGWGSVGKNINYFKRRWLSEKVGVWERNREGLESWRFKTPKKSKKGEKVIDKRC